MRLVTSLYEIPVELHAYVYVDSSSKNLLVFKNKENNFLFFIKIPSNIFLFITNKCFLSIKSYSILDINSFMKTVIQQVSILRFPFFVKLFLKGLGYRIQQITLQNEHFLEFKLGFSHSIRLKTLSKNIKVFVKKNALILRGFSRSEVGNLANRIYNLRKPNIYTGKGFRYKRTPFKLKEVKKT